MQHHATLSHTTWDGKYHVVCIPKDRRKALSKELRQHLGEVFRSLAAQKACRIEAGHLMPDHVHMLMAIPPQYAVSQVLGCIKGQAAIHIARTYLGRRKNLTGQHFWARGYDVTTVGRDEATIRASIQRQEEEDKRLDHMGLW
jgi:putative transposase